MNFMSLFQTIFIFICLVNALPLTHDLVKRDVYVPPVLYPRNGTVWSVGQRHNVTWDTSNPPKQITNRQGMIVLRKGDLTTPLILANGFDILRGHIEITVPFVFGGSDYSVVLFGDSGNFSPTFTIKSPVTF